MGNITTTPEEAARARYAKLAKSKHWRNYGKKRPARGKRRSVWTVGSIRGLGKRI
jgi:hypothetical protein